MWGTEVDCQNGGSGGLVAYGAIAWAGPHWGWTCVKGGVNKSSLLYVWI